MFGRPGRSGRAGSAPSTCAGRGPGRADGNHVVHEGVQPGGQHRRHDVEAVRRAAARTTPGWRRRPAPGVPEKVRCPRPPPSRPISCRTVSRSRRASSTIRVYRLLAPSIASSDGRSAGSCASSGRRFGRHPQDSGQLLPRVLGLDELVELLLQPPGLCLGGADDRDDARQDLDAVPGRGRRRPSCASGRRRNAAHRQGLLRGEHGLGVAGGEVLAVLGRAGLHDQRVALRRTRDVQRALDPEVPADVVDGADAGSCPPRPRRPCPPRRRRPPSCPRASAPRRGTRRPARNGRQWAGWSSSAEVPRGGLDPPWSPRSSRPGRR